MTDDGTTTCSHFQTCELFPLVSKGGFLKVWQINYCQGDFPSCARFQAAARGEHVPLSLLPNGKLLQNLR